MENSALYFFLKFIILRSMQFFSKQHMALSYFKFTLQFFNFSLLKTKKQTNKNHNDCLILRNATSLNAEIAVLLTFNLGEKCLQQINNLLLGNRVNM